MRRDSIRSSLASVFPGVERRPNNTEIISEVFTDAAPSDLPPPAILPAPAALFAPGPFSAAPSQPKPDNYLVWAILTPLMCCLPFGIVAVIFATQVDFKYATGDYAGAQIASGRAKLWSILSAGSLLLFAALYLGMFVFFGAVGVIGGMAQ